MGDPDSVFHDLANQDPTALARLVLGDPSIEAVGLPASLPIIRRRDGDALLLARRDRVEFLLHVECDLRQEQVESRLLEYAGIVAKREHRHAQQETRPERPIVSVLLRLHGAGHAAQRRVHQVPGLDEPTIVFRYLEVDVRGIEAEELLAMRSPALLPLVVLARGGDRDDVLERTVVALDSAQVSHEQRAVLLSSSWTLASVVGAHRMIARLKAMSWFKELPNVKELLEEGRAEGRVQGEATGQVKALAKVLRMRVARLGRPSPALSRKIAAIKDPVELERLVALAMDADT